MRKRLKTLIFRLTGGHFPIYVQQRSLVGARVTLVTTEAYELMLAELQWRWLRAFLIGMALVTVVGFTSFVMGVRTAWVEERDSFTYICQRVIERSFPSDAPSLREIKVDYPVANWALVPPKNFKPKGARP